MGLNVASKPQFQHVPPQKHQAHVKRPNASQNVSQPQQTFPQADQTQPPQFGLPAANGANQQQQPSIQDVLQMVLMLLQQSAQGGSQPNQAGATQSAKSCQ
jgi:hypothetical protein